MALSIYCSECDRQVEITKFTVYKEGRDIYVECDYCNDKEEVD